jgi:tRNA A-37 threonylcarbamoyl transferase component Bud32
MPPRPISRWLALASAAFAGLWVLLFSCDLYAIRPIGIDVERDAPGRLTVHQIRPGSSADGSDLRPGDVLLTVDGQRVASPLDFLMAKANVYAGRPWRLRLLRAGVAVDVAVPISGAAWRNSLTHARLTVLALRLVQLAILAVAMLIAFKRPRDPAALLASGVLAIVSISSVSLPDRFGSAWRSLPIPIGALVLLPFVAAGAIGGALFAFFTVFPRPVLPRRRLLITLVPAAAVGLWQGVFAWRLVWGPGTAGPIARALPGVIVINTVYAIGGLGVAAMGYRRLTGASERRRLRVVLTGTLIGWVAGASVFLGYWVGDYGATGRPLMEAGPLIGGTLLFFSFPLSFAYGILRHRLFDVSIVVRRGVRYALARSMLGLAVPALLGLLTVDLLGHHDRAVSEVVRQRGWVYLLIVLLGMTAHFRQRRWLTALDRRFFRERFNVQRLLHDISTDLRRFTERDGVGGVAVGEPASTAASGELVASVVAKIDEALHPESATVLVRNGIDGCFEPLPSAYALPLRLRHDSKVVTVAGVLQKPLETPVSRPNALSRDLPADERNALRAARIELLVPIVAGSQGLRMLLALGPRRSEEPYSQEDFDLLAGVGDALGLALACLESGRSANAADAEHGALGGRYRLDRKLGQGGMGTVYVATDLALGREVAVKLVRDDLVASAAAQARFQQETRIAASFAHPNIVTIHDFGILPGGRAFVVMELLHGSTLADRLRASGALPTAAVLSILHDVCGAIEVAHARGLLHRDLKPANIFLARDDGGERPKVLDFGIAKAIDSADSGLDASGVIVGTPRYMAPEQLRGEGPSVTWDIWALTTVAYEMLTGSHPFATPAAGTPGTFDAAQPEWRPFFEAALSFTVASRPPTVRALYARLAAAVAPAVVVM